MKNLHFVWYITVKWTPTIPTKPYSCTSARLDIKFQILQYTSLFVSGEHIFFFFFSLLFLIYFTPLVSTSRSEHKDGVVSELLNCMCTMKEHISCYSLVHVHASSLEIICLDSVLSMEWGGKKSSGEQFKLGKLLLSYRVAGFH